MQKVLLPVKGGTATGQPVLLIDRGPMGPVSSGQPFQITLNWRITDTVKGIRNLTATFEPNDQISLLEATDTRQIGDIGPGQSVDVSVNLKAGSELSSAASQLLGITLKFDYDTDKERPGYVFPTNRGAYQWQDSHSGSPHAKYHTD